MERTLFSPSMIETFRVCKKAYWLAFMPSTPRRSPATIVKGFLLHGLAEINKGKITSQSQIQKFMGQHWPIDELNDQVGGRDSATRAFLNTYKVLAKYLAHPYKPMGSEIVAVNTKVRSRLPGAKTYLEDTFDLLLWYPQEKRLEIVIFHLKALKTETPAWPSPSTLVRQYLTERLKLRWPFQKLTLTMHKIGLTENTISSRTLEEAPFQAHFPELVKSIEEMAGLQEEPSHEDPRCPYCVPLEKERNQLKVSEESVSLSA